MSTITYFVAQPFEMTKGGKLIAGPPQTAQTAAGAIRRAEGLAKRGGAIAFSRSGDPTTGDFDDAMVLKVFGQVPEELT